MSQTNEISFNLNGGFYPEESVLQAASMFQEVVEVVVNKIGKEYAVCLKPAEQVSDEDLQKLKNEFCNACLLCTNN